ncbi:MAG: LLM class flavin-dependent oxidoreductase [Xanthobacteraceae bacterium]|nr:LLM class flavin-dependent oxidoreductase [Xanthobacteraceae bacterium]
MNILMFHLMPYLALDTAKAAQYPASWVTLSNELYDPKQGAELYNRYLDELEYAETLGFDGICVNEHHKTPYGMMPSPAVTAAALSRRTKTCRIAILGNALPLRTHPFTIAEEHAMIDNITRGRLISGFVRGIGAEYHAFGVNPTQSLERFREAHDLIVRAWSEPGPFEWHSRHYHFEYVNVWPRPYQQPHPPIWIPSQGSRETIEFAADPSRKYTYLQTFSAISAVQKNLHLYRDVAQAYGYTHHPRQLGWATPLYVGDTDEQALAECAPHYEFFRNEFLSKIPLEMVMPPGYASRQSAKGIVAAKTAAHDKIDTRRANELGMMTCGSAKTVADRLIRYQKEIGFGNFLAMMQFGTMPADMTRRSMERFAESVMPLLRKASREQHGEFGFN